MPLVYVFWGKKKHSLVSKMRKKLQRSFCKAFLSCLMESFKNTSFCQVLNCTQYNSFNKKILILRFTFNESSLNKYFSIISTELNI